jgi:uncharacterized BrkB/YihY/UPF0761 family membrane protein
MWRLGGLGFRELVRGLYQQFREDRLLDEAAMLSFSFLLSIFPLLLFFSHRYNATYGSIAAVILLLLWFYLTGIAILLGGGVELRARAAGGGDSTAGEGVRLET